MNALRNGGLSRLGRVVNATHGSMRAKCAMLQVPAGNRASNGMAWRMASTSTSLPSLTNIEASWKTMSLEERQAIQAELEQAQKKDWTQLSINEKKAAYYIAFGPHGPRVSIDMDNGRRASMTRLSVLSLHGADPVGTHSTTGTLPQDVWRDGCFGRNLDGSLHSYPYGSP